MELKDMTIEELEARKTAIVAELDVEGADLDALETEMKSIKAEMENRKAAEAQKEEIRQTVAESTAPVVVQEFKEEKREMKTNEEIRASKEYIDAFARYLINEDDKECRALLTVDASGSVPVPAIVDDIIRTAWENDDILSRVRKTYIRGNLKVAFELSADGAYVHNEGTTAPTEESLALGIVTMIPKNIKKWITISDEAITMGGENLVRYIYDELTYQIVKKLAALVVDDIKGAPQVADADEASVAKITSAPGLTTVAEAAANTSDEATQMVVIMNKLTEVEFEAARAAGNFAVDPFKGLPVLYSSELPAYTSASANAVYAIVGDLKGVQVNYPEGDGIAIKYDDLSLAEKDMVKIVGRQYAAHALTACGRFCVIAKPSGATT
ncbi:MAG: phage major capsid protein [Spirochaetales bacterium]|nr:phage major capsid protein [Spirochaetales bacterium]